MDTTFSADALTIGLGLLIARLVLGLLMAAHGAQKLFGWFGGHGLAGTGGFFESIGFRPVLVGTLAAIDLGSPAQTSGNPR